MDTTNDTEAGNAEESPPAPEAGAPDADVATPDAPAGADAPDDPYGAAADAPVAGAPVAPADAPEDPYGVAADAPDNPYGASADAPYNPDGAAADASEDPDGASADAPAADAPAAGAPAPSLFARPDSPPPTGVVVHADPDADDTGVVDEKVPTGDTPIVVVADPEPSTAEAARPAGIVVEAPPAHEPPGPPPAPPTPPPAPREGSSWAVRLMLGLGVLIVLAVLAFVGVVVVSRGGPGPEPARAEAEAFTKAFSAGDIPGMQALIEPAGANVADDLSASLGKLGLTRTTVTLVPGPIAGEGDTRTAKVTMTLNPPELPPITYENTIPFRKIDDDNHWRVQWSRALIHPALTGARHFDRVSQWAPRGYLLDANGQPLATVNGQVTITVLPANVVDRPGLEAALASSLGIDAAAIDKAFTAAKATGSAPIKTVSWAEYSKAKSAIYDIKGLRFAQVGDSRGTGSSSIQAQVVGQTTAATADQAAALGPPYQEGDEIGASGLQASQQKALGGLPATEVRIVEADGTVVQSMVKVDGSPPRNVKTTIDPNIQSIAERTIGSGVGGHGAAMVVMDRNGGVKAMANSSSFNWATAQYPPGSTMKVVTAEALLVHGLGPDTQLSCPPTYVAAGQPFQNFEGEAEASLTFTRAFTISCNTAFLMAAEKLSGNEMREAAARFGFTVPYDAGIPMTVQGSFPDDGPGAAKSSMAIGQGRVLSNPLHMASVAATVMSGQWHSPTFLAERPADLPVGTPLDPRVRSQLEGFMRSVVDNGTATAAQVPGKVVYGKTGTAEIGTGPNPETHAWFLGYSGDLAIAIVVDHGGVGGRVAAPLAKTFFSQV